MIVARPLQKYFQQTDSLTSGADDEEGSVLEVEAGVPLLPWNILVTWPPGTV